MPETENTYPEHEKLLARKPEHEKLTRFCMFLQSKRVLNKKVVITDEDDDVEEVFLRDLSDMDIINLLAEYFDIDYEKFQEEKHKMLEEIRKP